jgi:hypothetical protein
MSQPIQVLIDTVVPIVIAFIASSGFWLYLDRHKDKKTLQADLLIGLAHDRIVGLGMKYITRGWITQDEYENLNAFLYKPYEALGGNGSVKRIIQEVDKLPIKRDKFLDKLTGETLP